MRGKEPNLPEMDPRALLLGLLRLHLPALSLALLLMLVQSAATRPSPGWVAS